MNNDGLKKEISDMSNDIDQSALQLDDIVDTLVESCCKELDDYVVYIKQLLDDTQTPISDVELDDFVMTLPTLLYFVGSSQESLGIREDIAKMNETDKYNRVFTEAVGTVAVKQSFAKLQTKNESLASIVYQRACKKIKLRVDAAYEVLQSCKKVLSRRMAELELSKNSLNRNAS